MTISRTSTERLTALLDGAENSNDAAEAALWRAYCSGYLNAISTEAYNPTERQVDDAILWARRELQKRARHAATMAAIQTLPPDEAAAMRAKGMIA